MGQTFCSDLEPIIGFLDESSLKSEPARRRVINTPVVKYSDGAGKKRSWTMFGFLALNGKDVVMVSERAKAPDVAEFLELVREENGGELNVGGGKRPILVVLDNARIHVASSVKEKAKALHITRAFLPPYSPDLMPIEFGWKDLKRELSAYLNFDHAVCLAKETTLNLFSQRRYSYSKHWICNFICPKSP
ncbi:transposase [Candidatus Bathyarchaeota archaeon]|nr:transposase [Candidatus Bathyarchaeota archaeon]